MIWKNTKSAVDLFVWTMVDPRAVVMFAERGFPRRVAEFLDFLVLCTVHSSCTQHCQPCRQSGDQVRQHQAFIVCLIDI